MANQLRSLSDAVWNVSERFDSLFVLLSTYLCRTVGQRICLDSLRGETMHARRRTEESEGYSFHTPRFAAVWSIIKIRGIQSGSARGYRIDCRDWKKWQAAERPSLPLDAVSSLSNDSSREGAQASVDINSAVVLLSSLALVVLDRSNEQALMPLTFLSSRFDSLLIEVPIEPIQVLPGENDDDDSAAATAVDYLHV